MAGNEKTGKRSRGEHLRKNEVKTEIIRYILSKNDVVPGPDIIKYLRKKSNILDEKNIRIHLINLQKQHCIEKIPGKPGLENKWKIEKIENLRNIQEYYSEIKLNKYSKSLDMVSKIQLSKGYSIWDPFIRLRDFRIQLYYSDSFFHACLNGDIEKLCNEAYEYYKYGEGFEECKHIQNCIDKFYNECIKLILVSPKIWLDVYNMNTSNFSELEIHQNIVKSLPDIKISERTFREILEEDHIWRFYTNDWKPRFIEEFSIKLADMVCQKMQNKISTESQEKWEKELKTNSIDILREILAEIPEAINSRTKNPVFFNNEFDMEIAAVYKVLEKRDFDEFNFIFCREIFAKITYEIFQIMFKDIPVEFLDTPEMFKILNEILKKILREVLKETQVDERYKLLTKVLVHRINIGSSIDQIIFKHYFDRDIEDGTISSDEREYMVMMKNLQVDFKAGIISRKDVSLALNSFFEDHIKNKRKNTKSV